MDGLGRIDYFVHDPMDYWNILLLSYFFSTAK